MGNEYNFSQQWNLPLHDIIYYWTHLPRLSCLSAPTVLLLLSISISKTSHNPKGHKLRFSKFTAFRGPTSVEATVRNLGSINLVIH